MKTGVYFVIAVVVFSAGFLIVWDQSVGRFARASAIHGFLKQCQMAVRHYSERWDRLPPIQEWRQIAYRTEDPLHLFDWLHDPQVMVAQSQLWGDEYEGYENLDNDLPHPLIVLNDGSPFPADTLYVIIEGCDLVCVLGEGKRQKIDGANAYVAYAGYRIHRLADACRGFP